MSRLMTGTNQTANVAAPYTGNYIGKYPAQLGNGTTNLETTGAWALTTQGIDGKYMIDISANMKTYMQEDTPLLTIMMNLPSVSSMGGPYCVWNDEYKGTSWFDGMLDHLRLVDKVASAGGWTAGNGYFGSTLSGSELLEGNAPVAFNDSTYDGGKLTFCPIASAADVAVNTEVVLNTTTATLNKIVAKTSSLATTQVTVNFGIEQSGSMQGHVNTVWNALRQRLSSCGYTLSTHAAAGGVTGYAAVYNASAYGVPVYFAFDTLVWTDEDPETDVTKVSFEVMARIERVIYQIKGTTITLAFMLNLSDSNLYGEIDAGDFVYLGPNSGADKHQTIVSRMMYMGQSTKPAGPVPEGDKFKSGGGITSYRENKTNNCQIFMSESYGVTGTHQASKFKFGDDFADTRAHHMMLYKRQKNSTYWFGMKGETQAVSNTAFMNGQPARATGGFMDYALFPINYVYAPLSNLTWATDLSSANFVQKMEDYLERIGERLLAFRHGGARSITLMCSLKKMRLLTKYNRALAINAQFMGGAVQQTPPSQINFGLDTWTYTTARGTKINFIHEPALDYMTTWPLPYWIFNTGAANPQDIMFSIDTANIAECVHRSDKIEGNIQDPGQDAFLEGMRGESGFILRFPKNHAIIYAPEA